MIRRPPRSNRGGSSAASYVDKGQACGRLKGGELGLIYVDAHECEIVNQTWQMFEVILPRLPNVKAVCYECEGVNKNSVLSTLKRIRKIVREKSANDELVETLANYK